MASHFMNRKTVPLVTLLLGVFLLPVESFGQFAKNTNQSRTLRSVLVGGSGNVIFSNSTAAFIGGGMGNIVTNTATYGAIVGGANNINNGYASSVAGGLQNVIGAGATTAFIGGGDGNEVSGNRATVGGGVYNKANGTYAAVPGGARGWATNAGAFVWSGDITEPTGSFGDFTFTVRCEGGARFYTANGTGTGASLPAGGGAWNNLSDRNAKANFRRVNGAEVLAKVAAMPVMTWNYKTQAEEIRHIGPTAQDFRSAFGLGDNDTTISTIDPSGVALAAIQGLVEEIRLRDEKIAQLEARSLEQKEESKVEIEDLKTELRAIREQLSKLPLR